MENVCFGVSDLGNSQAKTKVKNSLGKIDGVQEVSVDLARGTINVEFNSPATKEEIRDCIKNTGYTVQ